MIDLGRKLKSLRIERHLTQQQVANRVGVSKAMISSYELSARSPSYEVLVKLAREFAVTTDFLLGVGRVRSLDIVGLSERQVQLIANLIEEFKSE